MRATNAARYLLLPFLSNLTVCLALLIAVPGHALTLGNLRGGVLVGRTLNVTVPVLLDAGEQAASLCAQVDVFFADTRVLDGRVRSGWQVPEATKEGLLRVETSVVVDEPVVAVHVTAGCVRKTSRKYVLLADVPTETARGSTIVLPAVPLAAATRRDAANTAVGNGETVEVAEQAAEMPNSRSPQEARSKPLPKPPAKVAPVKSRPVPVKPEQVASAKPPAASLSITPRAAPDTRARLKLEIGPEVNANLKSTFELLSTPAENDQAREDAKTLWRTLNAQPEDVLREAKRLQALEAQVKSLQSAQSKNLQAQDALKAQLSQAETERYVNPLVGGLAALLLCALGGGVYVWFRMRQGGFGAGKDWWKSQSAEPSILSDLAPADPSTRLSIRGRDSKSGRESKSGRVSRTPDADAGSEESIFDSLKARAAGVVRAVSPKRAGGNDSVLPRSGFFHSSMGTRSVNVEELFDVQQQAEFFVSLGQHEQAIDLLQQHIYGSTNTSGLAYLDLLALYHQFNRRADYDQLRQEFNHLFNAHVPLFENYHTQQNRGIARYTDAMSRIQTSWNTPDVLDVLQDLIFRKPDAASSESFDLMAYRELMLLFAIAKDIQESNPGLTGMGHEAAGVSAVAKSAEPPRIAPLDFSVTPGSGDFKGAGLAGAVRDDSMTVPGVNLPKPSPRLGLDVDLFELESTMSPLTGVESVADSHTLDFSLSLPGDATVDVPPAMPAKQNDKVFDLSDFLLDQQDPSLNLATPPVPPVPKDPVA